MTGLAWLARKLVPELLHHVVRPVDRVVPARLIQAAAWPAVSALALLDLAYLGTRFAAFDRLPGSIRSGRSRPAWRAGLVRDRTRVLQSQLVGTWAGRLTAPRWRGFCRVEGPAASRERLESRAGPVVLATIHFGPLDMLFCWLRSRGVPVAALTTTPEEDLPHHISRRRALCDREGGCEGLPRRFLPSQLWETADFLRADRVVLVLMTGGCGRAVEVSDGDLTLPVAPGALKLAALAGADLVPCLALAEPGGGVTIALGEAVPPSELADRRGHPLVCQRLFGYFAPALCAHPGQIHPWLLERLRANDDRAGERTEPEGNPVSAEAPGF